METAHHFLYPLPLDICGTHTQGGMGYMLQREILNASKERGVEKTAFTVVTQCLVDPEDWAFQNPTKPIGSFFTKEKIAPMIEHGWVAKEDAGRGWRRVVPSPEPKTIVEEDIIKKAIEFSDVVVC